MPSSTARPLKRGTHFLLVNEVQVEVRAEEARVRVLFHEPKDAFLCQIKAAPRDALQVVLGVFPRVRVQVYLQGQRGMVRAVCRGLTLGAGPGAGPIQPLTSRPFCSTY